MRRLLAILALLTIALISAGSQPLIAADVVCNKKYVADDTAGDAQRLWPSGFRPRAGMCKEGHIHGAIVPGDYEKVRAFYRGNHPLLGVFSMSSPGGDVEEAMKIGRLFRKYLIHVSAPHQMKDGALFAGHDQPFPCQATRTCVCASACALIWLGGISRGGTVGLHRPRTDDPSFARLAAADASKLYIRVLNEIVAYSREMEAPTLVVDAMIATGSAEIHWVNADVPGLRDSPSIAEWIAASCGSYTEQEMNRSLEFALDKMFTKRELTQDEAMLAKALDDKISKVGRCRWVLIRSQVDRLPAP